MKTTGPCLSLAASGSLGNAITYSRAGGKNICKRKSNPTQPNSLAQIAAREVMKFLINAWKNFSVEEVAYWTAQAYDSPLNIYTTWLRTQMKKFHTMEQIQTLADPIGWVTENQTYSTLFIRNDDIITIRADTLDPANIRGWWGGVNDLNSASQQWSTSILMRPLKAANFMSYESEGETVYRAEFKFTTPVLSGKFLSCPILCYSAPTTSLFSIDIAEMPTDWTFWE
jgi:hypothetical protein